MPLWAKLFLLGIGLIFLGAGVAIGVFGTRDALARAALAERLAPRGAAAIEDTPVGAEVLVEGALSPRNRPRFREFVAYTVEEYRGVDDDGDPEWALIDTVTPPLIIEAGGLVSVGNEDYRLEHSHAEYQDPGPLTRGDLARESTKRYRGLVAGQVVTAIGTVAEGPEGNELRAELVYAGTRAEYIAGQRQAAVFLPVFGALFGLVGAIVAGFGVFVLLRG